MQYLQYLKRPLGLISFFIALIVLYNVQLLRFPQGTPYLPQKPVYTSKILLVPLDSRPPCLDLVIDTGRLASREVLTPKKALDYYTLPGDSSMLRAWMEENANQSSTMILSLDQFFFGGLLAAREKEISPTEMENGLAFLTSYAQRHPNLKIRAFITLPRATPPDSIEGYYEKRRLLAYSRAVGRYQVLGDERDAAEAKKLADKIDPQSLAQYLDLFHRNEILVQHLMNLTAQGVFQQLVIAQDDGEEYSISNNEKQRLVSYRDALHLPQEKVPIVHGADEIATDLLAADILAERQVTPAIYLEFNETNAATCRLPYMAIPLQEAAEEKIALLGAHVVSAKENADLTLFLFAGTKENLATRRASADKIKNDLETDNSVALVDLSEHFSAGETVFPFLLANQTPLHQLCAYAGWNTASNAVGTALAQATIFLAMQNPLPTQEEAQRLAYERVRLLDNRFLEDFYYLKYGIDVVNVNLKKAGFENVYDLDLKRNYRWADQMLWDIMTPYTKALAFMNAYRVPFTVNTAEGRIQMAAYKLDALMGYPWPRTFEIRLWSTPYLLTVAP